MREKQISRGPDHAESPGVEENTSLAEARGRGAINEENRLFVYITPAVNKVSFL